MSPNERARLLDLPLRGDGAPGGFDLPLAGEAPGAERDSSLAAAPLSARAIAFAADLAGTSLAVTLALIAGIAATGRAPLLSGLPWAAAFAIGFSFVFVCLPLTLFGRTVGMALAGLTARAGAFGRRLTPGEAARRWAGTALVVAGLGLPLLVGGDPLRGTPADRLSGRLLIRDAEG
ncbi:MAG: RDD family protein [Acidobacteriota bacterium]